MAHFNESDFKDLQENILKLSVGIKATLSIISAFTELEFSAVPFAMLNFDGLTWNLMHAFTRTFFCGNFVVKLTVVFFF